MYAGRGEGLSGEVDGIVMYLIVKCNDKTSIAAAERVMHRKGLQATVAFPLKVRRVNIIMRNKNRKIPLRVVLY